jgi:2-keto-3-deoxy-L-fuconate dehydrogenase
VVEDVAELASFLVGKGSTWITGAIVPVDGGAAVTRR